MKNSHQATKPRLFVRMFQRQFIEKIADKTKGHTIRPTPKRMPRIGDIISLRYWQDKPYHSKQVIISDEVITSVYPIHIFKTGVIFIEKNPSFPGMYDALATPSQLEEFAISDGFNNPNEFMQFFQKHHGFPFTGIMIKWT